MDLPSAVATEDLLAQVRQIPEGTTSFELWVPATLTFGGKTILRAAGIAIVQEAMEARGFTPAGAAHAQEGTLCSFRKKPTANQ
jgi:hypothetical protein